MYTPKLLSLKLRHLRVLNDLVKNQLRNDRRRMSACLDINLHGINIFILVHYMEIGCI